MTTPTNTQHWIALSLIPGLGNASLRKLLQAFGEPERVFATDYHALKLHVKEAVARAISNGIDLASITSTTDWLQEPNNHVVTFSDADYPESILQITDPPPLFYLKGQRALLNQASFAIVGSRNATPQGLKNAEAFAQTLSNSGYCIVSGLALGIDAAAHHGGLNGVSGSLAVVGTGLDIVYPARNRALAHQLAANGAILSEYPLGTPAIAGNFPKRNRLISGLTHGCLVVEAALQSGSLITAKLAAEQGKEVFAIPGSIHSPLSKGCHSLIKQGAKLVESAQDILEELGQVPLKETCHSTIQQTETDDHPLMKSLGFESTDIDTLANRSGLTTDRVCAMLLELELEGRVASLPGGQYQRIS
ncbi:DNA-processing protein DprA [Sulfurirhabdus autotrophica]|uniref:DNA protecting protein DprA n=1 Tax=Sulfurirhabdus autotrophica TaxID=1706046 RepID=A0A4R3XSH7_9PROT|nr:DNA-processing protein DprA [Sulfurirhabdus autotrophica]TCV80247.1 DNA protecting protein DprA [Sulfurirhabdus autotrophica]